MLVAATGCTGFVGSYVARRLASEPEVRLRALVRASGRREFLAAAAPEAEFVTGGLEDAEALRALVAGADAVVHTAYGEPGASPQRAFYGAAPGETTEWAGAAGTEYRRRFLAENLLGTVELLAAAREAGVRHFIYVSSHAVYGRQPHEGPTGEETPLAGRNAYTSFKVAAEAFCGSFARFIPTLTILRPPLILGVEPRPEKSVYWEFAQKILRGAPLEVSGGANTVLVDGRRGRRAGARAAGARRRRDQPRRPLYRPRRGGRDPEGARRLEVRDQGRRPPRAAGDADAARARRGAGREVPRARGAEGLPGGAARGGAETVGAQFIAPDSLPAGRERTPRT